MFSQTLIAQVLNILKTLIFLNPVSPLNTIYYLLISYIAFFKSYFLPSVIFHCQPPPLHQVNTQCNAWTKRIIECFRHFFAFQPTGSCQILDLVIANAPVVFFIYFFLWVSYIMWILIFLIYFFKKLILFNLNF